MNVKKGLSVMKRKSFKKFKSVIIISSIIMILPLVLSACNKNTKNSNDKTTSNTPNKSNSASPSDNKSQNDWVATNKYTINGDTPAEYIIENVADVDNQTNMQCAACSSAYLLRFYGYEADGLKLYEDFPSKNNDGTINPAGFKQFFERYTDLEPQFYTGTIDDLKNAVSHGIPQIVLVRTTPSSPYLHYMPVVGYDEENIYLQDSIPTNRNSDDSRYNRKVSIDDFQKMRDINIEYYKDLFITIIKK